MEQRLSSSSSLRQISDRYLLNGRYELDASRSCETLTRSLSQKFRLPDRIKDRYYVLSHLLSDIINSSCAINGHPNINRSSQFLFFYSNGIHAFTIQQYLFHIMTHSGCSESVFIVAFLYMMRAQKKNDLLRVCEYNVHRVYFVCVVIAAKMLEYAILPNSKMAIVGGLESTQEINRLELLMLKVLDYNLGCSKFHYKALFRIITSKMARS